MTARIGVLALAICALGLSLSCFLLPRSRVRVAAAFWLAWLVPGLGHFLVGRRWKALFFATSLSAAYLAGLWICGGRVVTFDENPFYYVGQFGSGLTTLVGALLATDRPFRADVPVSWYDPGLLYVCIAGLLNVVVMLSVFNVSSTPDGRPATRAGTTAQPLGEEEEVRA